MQQTGDFCAARDEGHILLRDGAAHDGTVSFVHVGSGRKQAVCERTVICEKEKAGRVLIKTAGRKKISAQIRHFIRAARKPRGIADEIRMGPEYEFHVFSDVSFSTEHNGSHYHIDSPEAHWNRKGDDFANDGNLGYKQSFQGAYHAAPPSDIIERTSAKSRLIRPGIVINSEIP